MTSLFQESDWIFDFDPAQWPSVLKWDEDVTYRGAQQRLTGRTRRKVKGCGRGNCHWKAGRNEQFVSESTRAVDFAAVGPQNRPYLIEVKHLQGGGPFETIDERAFKIAAKVRDSLSGIGFAQAGYGDEPAPELASVRQRLRSSAKVVVVIVFDQPNDATQLMALRSRLEQLLCWLRGRVVVTDSVTGMPGVTITPVT